MPLTTDTITAPACWASYLINGDDSGMDPEEIEACNDWLAANNNPSIVGTEDDEPWFTWSYATYGGTAAGGEVLDYIAHWR